MSKCKVDPCGACSLRVKTNPILCLQYCKWIHGRCAGVKSVTPKFSNNFTSRKCEGNIGEAVEQEETLCDEMQIIMHLTYLDNRVIAGGECEAAVIAKIRCWVVNLRECGELLYGREFPLKLKWAVRPAILHGSEAWCLTENEIGILHRTERSTVRAMCGVLIKDRRKSIYLIFMLELNINIDQLTMVNSVHWYGHVMRKENGHVMKKENGHVLRRTLDFEADCQRKKGKQRIHGKKRLRKKV